MAEEKIVTLVQPEGTGFRHDGQVSLFGDADRPALRHELGGEVVHVTNKDQPLVHMVCWDEDDSCRVEVSGKVTLAGDCEAPVQVRMAHEFTNVHDQTHQIATTLHEPIHHALQLRTPLEVRFCNAFHVVSDYTLEIRTPRGPLASLHLTGATICTPQPCPDETPCKPVVVRQPIHP
jgi:hypothetical protein